MAYSVGTFIMAGQFSSILAISTQEPFFGDGYVGS
jgi:hypothetical protein